MSDLTNAEKRDRDLLQAGFVKGAEWYHRNRHDPICMADSLAAAKLEYPDPYEPKIVTLSNGIQRRIRSDGVVEVRDKAGKPWELSTYTKEDFALYGMLAHEYSERTK